MDRGTLGVDIGSTYTKIVVAGAGGAPLFRAVVPTRSRRPVRFEEALRRARERFAIGGTCATGYGRHGFPCDRREPELICAAIGASASHPVRKCIVDIGGEDLKIIECDVAGAVLGFHVNDKCSAGTGTFLTEIAEKAELEIGEMSDLARRSAAERTLNSFCTVFARTEVLEWKFAGASSEEIARGIYLSLVNRIARMPIPGGLPVVLCGGVIAHHPYLGELLGAAIDAEIEIAPEPQFTVALGAALVARNGAPAS